MSPRSPRQRYRDWVQDRIEEHKSGLTRDELLSLADRAVTELFDSGSPQYPLTEILLRDAVDTLIFEHLGLPGYRKWLRTCQTDTPTRPHNGTDEEPSSGEISA
jgi:hypothetical protein